MSVALRHRPEDRVATRAAAGRADVIVTDAAQRQALVALRQLGRSARRALAVDFDATAPAFRSRLPVAAVTVPDFHRDQGPYVDALLDLCAAWRPAALIPCHDGSIEAVRSRRGDVERLVGLALAPEEALAVAVDKALTLDVAAGLGLRSPRGLIVRDARDAAMAVRETGLPAVVKPSRSWVQGDARTPSRRLACVLATSADEAGAAAAAMLELGVEALVQEWLPGSREAVSLVYARGRFWARFAQRADRTSPPLGGNSVVRVSIPLPEDATAAAERLVAEIGLDGYSEVEFRRDAEGRPVLMEINPRLSASVEIAVRAGVPFPTLMHDWASGATMQAARGYRTGVRMRWLGGDLAWLAASLRAAAGPDVPPRAAALRTFAADFARPARYDYVDVRDPRPAVAAAAQFARRSRRRVRGRSGAAAGADTEVAVIGAGPYGLSVAATLTDRGVRHEVFGDPMDGWQNHMPAGMHLKSEGFASNLHTPRGGHTLEAFCAETGREYGTRGVPIPLETFVAYGRWFQDRAVPELRPVRVRQVRSDGGGFAVMLEDGDTLVAKRVVIASGLAGCVRIPRPLADLPAGRLTHSYDLPDVGALADRDVVVVGAGQSAIEGAVLLHERGGAVRLVARTDRLAWNSHPGRGRRSLRSRLHYPESGLGAGWAQRLCSDLPALYRLAPADLRERKAFELLGPAGAWWIRPRFEGHVDARLGRALTTATVEGDRVRLRLDGPAGAEDLVTDHVVAATGYRADVRRVPVLAPELAARVDAFRGNPVLDQGLESSVPGLHFVSYLAAASFGPLMRFVFGTRFAAERVANRAAAHR